VADERETMTGETMAGVLGAAVIEAWGDLPREIQETLFERAVANGHGDTLRHGLARFLHERHPHGRPLAPSTWFGKGNR
jgi:hypothetical protein